MERPPPAARRRPRPRRGAGAAGRGGGDRVDHRRDVAVHRDHVRAHATPNGPATRRRTGSRGPSSPWPTTCRRTCDTGCSPAPDTYRAFVRFAGPGPTAPPDLRDNAIMSIGVKVLGVAGPKLLDEESSTQDLLGISAPTFTTPDVVQNAVLQQEIGNSDAAVLLHPSLPPAPGGPDHAGSVRGHRREPAAGRLRQLRPLPAGGGSGRAVPVRAATRGRRRTTGCGCRCAPGRTTCAKP